MMNKYVAKTFHGLESVLANELKDLGAQKVEQLRRAVAFEGDEELLYKANMCLRTALRILHPLGVQKVKNQYDLYDFAFSINWMRWFTSKQTIAVRANVFNAPAFNNSAFVALKVKDAVVDQLRKYKGERPFVDKRNPDIRINVHIYKEQCTISIDSSGDSLHRRGYRKSNHRAPLNEVLAAGMVMLSGWDLSVPLVDPFCGSGTILTEAGMFARNIAPNVHREEFGFSRWKNYDKKLFDKVWLEARAEERSFKGEIYGSDISRPSVQMAQNNVKQAKTHPFTTVSQSSFEQLQRPAGERGVIVTNPPYGERLSDFDIKRLYKNIGDKLKQDFTGYEAWIISSVPKFNRFVGLRPSQKMTLFNGGLECRYLQYEIYSGSKRK